MHYFAMCHRKLWLFNRGIGFELEHDRVIEGLVLHDQAYSRLTKEVSLDEFTTIDTIDGDIVREVKISSRMEHADRLQMLYYLYLLRQRGIEKKGLLSYPKEKKTVGIELDAEGEQEIEQAIKSIDSLLSGKVPNLRKKTYCKKCAYFDYCFVGEEEDAV
ncbi:CRISPR-associated protein Cas4 [Paenibacillus sp. 481]|nr:CRISPR-associated protein Cas4 [Paenibacillus sp. 481]